MNLKFFYIILFILFIILLLFSVFMGDGGHILSFSSDFTLLIIEEIRLPRALLGVFVGASLGLCGCAMQGLLQNPLAEPSVIGASGCAAFGAIIAFYFGLINYSSLILPLGGIIGALIGIVILLFLSSPEYNVITVILAGTAISVFAGALSALALMLAPNPYAALEIVFWMLGSLTDRSMSQFYLSVPFILIGMFMIIINTRALDALSLGDDVAYSLGINLPMVKVMILTGTAMAVGASVAVSGIIGFVGLIVPHIVRMSLNVAPGKLLLPSAVGGACLLLCADIIIRLPANIYNLKIGVVTSLLGAPFFIFLVIKNKFGWL